MFIYNEKKKKKNNKYNTSEQSQSKNTLAHTSAEVDSCKLLMLNVVVCSKYVKKINKKNSEFDFVSAACMMSLYYNVINVIY
jgi:hypothetical protein